MKRTISAPNQWIGGWSESSGNWTRSDYSENLFGTQEFHGKLWNVLPAGFRKKMLHSEQTKWIREAILLKIVVRYHHLFLPSWVLPKCRFVVNQ
jgi:hypothetical protein